MESLAQAGLISDAITSFKISRLADQKNDGEITFGGLDESKFDASTLVTFDNVNEQGFWEGAMTVSVNGQDLGLQGRTAILDTGTTLIIAPEADAAAVHQAIPGAKSDGQGGFTIPCTTTASVALTFGGQDFAIDPRDLLFAPVDPNDLTGDCVSGISSLPRSAMSSSRTHTSRPMSVRTRYHSRNPSSSSASESCDLRLISTIIRFGIALITLLCHSA